MKLFQDRSRQEGRTGRMFPALKWMGVLALLVLPLAMAQAGSSPNYRWDESKSPLGPNRCSDSSQCDGQRTCSEWGWCQGEARPSPPTRDRARLPQPRFFIESRLSRHVLDIQQNNREPGASVIAYPAKSEGNDNQLWELVPGPGGLYIQSRLNGLVLDVQGANRTPGTPIITWTPKGGDNQLWRLVPSHVPGYFYIQNRLNGFVLDIEGATSSAGARLIAHPTNQPATDNQLWKLVLW
jgi:hypothetical protein